MGTLSRVFVANRGEIAVRIIEACHAEGIEAVLGVSEADREGRGTDLADRIVCIGPAAAQASYLNSDALIMAAKGTGCDALHPGYGFLAENAGLAGACGENDILFVGPRPETIEQLGDKLAARRVAAEAGVPLMPGSEAVGSVDEAVARADAFDYPVVIKAAAGGGGRGMFVAREPEAIRESFDKASAEASAAFGDGTLYMERFIANARHIEVQVLADDHGNAVHLGERDCSAQRRYQKVVEEAPAPALSDTARTGLHEAALQLVSHIGYRNAGTVEFLYDMDQNEPFFIEMNARIQVEHPVTEMITGIDIVREQLRIAGGAPLSFAQADVALRGHAIECRINAESPDREFAPSPGRITVWRPPSGEGLRLDSHIRNGDLVPPFYDSMIGKLIAYAPTRAEALTRLGAALDDFAVEGIDTNIAFQRTLLAHPDFVRGGVSVRWLETVLMPAIDTQEG
jgi:acetyl-CoA carboxylase, biotin carboxylase subunit